jgi:hypothetical protein
LIKKIKEGNLRFETSDLDRTYNQIITNIKRANGNWFKWYWGKDYGTVYRKLVVRIPSQNFDVLYKNIKAEIDNKEITAEDVTAQALILKPD